MTEAASSPSAGDHRSTAAGTQACVESPAAGRRERLVALAEREWVRFGRREAASLASESDAASRETDHAVADYWTAVPTDEFDGYGRVVRDLWRSDAPAARRIHWSAAFTSWLACRAGYSMAEFRRSMRHAIYVAHARSPDAAHRIAAVDSVPPRTGDLLCANLGGEIPSVAVLPENARLHCLVVTEVSAREAVVIGGNIGDAVAKVRVPLQGDGTQARIAQASGPQWLLLLRERDPR